MGVLMGRMRWCCDCGSGFGRGTDLIRGGDIFLVPLGLGEGEKWVSWLPSGRPWSW